MPYYIKERHNPQTGVYYVPIGAITVRESKRHENPRYGHNVMLRYNTRAEYIAACKQYGLIGGGK